MILGTRDAQLARMRTQGWRVVTFKTAPVIAAYQELAGKVFLKAWSGKADVPAFYYSFRTLTQAQEYAERFVANVQSSMARVLQRAAERKAVRAADFYAVGDVVENSWGYDQTNVDFYEVTEVKEKSIVMREVKQNCSDHGGPSGGSTQPRRGEFCGEPFTKKVGERGWIAFKQARGRF